MARESRSTLGLTALWIVQAALGASLFGQVPVSDLASPVTMPDGTPLEGEQFPRFLRPTHEGMFGFEDFLVIGDHSTVTFERRDVESETGYVKETWSRVGTTSVGGLLASVFQPIWTTTDLNAGLQTQRWGVDHPYLLWGEVVVPAVGGTIRRDVYLQIVPTNIPRSRVVQVDDSIQYASHTVNIWIPDFAESRLSDGDRGIDIAAVTRRFYDVFADDYETIAILSQTTLLTSQIGFRRNVQNQIEGIGIPLFDESGAYGSAGTLLGVEVYPPGGWAAGRATLHQQVHQWGECSRVWDQLSIDRLGDDPARHTPLIGPGAVLAGAVLEGTRSVALAGSQLATIALTPSPIEFHPLTLYRMGLIDFESLPEIRVFREQGQFNPDQRSSPPVGTVVQGELLPVFASDFVAADGQRRGPIASRVRRATIYVSRDGLASSAEMDVVNFYAARMAEQNGVTSWDGYPSFFEATGGLATMTTDVTPRPGATVDGKIEAEGLTLGYLDVANDVLTGVLLDSPIPGRIVPNQAVTLSGIVTADDRDDFTIVCFRFIRYGSVDPNEVFLCSSLAGNRFSVDHTFRISQRGTYTVEPFLFWGGSGPQFARSRYGVVVVD